MNPVRSYHAFTFKYTGLTNRILTDVGVSDGFDPETPPTPIPQTRKYRALWDTGASGSCISKKVATDLGLKAASSVLMNTAGGQRTVPTYVANIYISNEVVVPGVLVSEFENHDFDVIIGMGDILTKGDLTISNFDGKTWCTFRMPSRQSIDYVKEQYDSQYTGTGRNALCDCGSGKKFKRCHGSPDARP